MQPKESFEKLLLSFGYRHDLRSVFDDFLTMTLCAFSQNPQTHKSFDEDLYLRAIARYTKDEADVFPKLLGSVICEMEARLESTLGFDILGSFYETHLSRKGASQYFTPWHVCVFMSEITCVDSVADDEDDTPKQILDPCCGSGRMLMASSRNLGPRHEYYGIDIDSTCVKMSAINLFLSGIFHGEVMCADALSSHPEVFKESYKLSMFPFGIFRITDCEQSPLWRSHVALFPSRKQPSFTHSPFPRKGDTVPDKVAVVGSQLTMF